MRHHTKLRVFELADEVAILCYRMTPGFPKEELYDPELFDSSVADVY